MMVMATWITTARPKRNVLVESTLSVTRERLREERERLVGELDDGAARPFAVAVRSFLTATAEKDLTLMRSHLDAALEAFRSASREEVRKRLDWPRLAREVCQRVRELLTDLPFEDLDEIGKELEAGLGRMLNGLLALRDSAVKPLQEVGYEVENAGALETAVAELRDLKQSLFENWPWSHRELPPVDRNMVAESRAAFRRQGGERVEDLIRRLGGSPAEGI